MKKSSGLRRVTKTIKAADNKIAKDLVSLIAKKIAAIQSNNPEQKEELGIEIQESISQISQIKDGNKIFSFAKRFLSNEIKKLKTNYPDRLDSISLFEKEVERIEEEAKRIKTQQRKIKKAQQKQTFKTPPTKASSDANGIEEIDATKTKQPEFLEVYKIWQEQKNDQIIKSFFLKSDSSIDENKFNQFSKWLTSITVEELESNKDNIVKIILLMAPFIKPNSAINNRIYQLLTEKNDIIQFIEKSPTKDSALLKKLFSLDPSSEDLKQIKNICPTHILIFALGLKKQMKR